LKTGVDVQYVRFANTVADMDKFFPQQRDLLDEWINLFK
jgi:hypothetical protein